MIPGVLRDDKLYFKENVSYKVVIPSRVMGAGCMADKIKVTVSIAVINETFVHF